MPFRRRTNTLKLWTIFSSDQVTHLRTPTSPISEAIRQLPETRRLAEDMIQVMRRADGIGLAAPQVGSALRLAVIDKSVTPDGRDLIILNPRITEESTQLEPGEEGCLSIPGVYGIVPRHTRIHVTYLTLDGQECTIEATALFARVLQHEIDHLEGRLFIDRATSITKGASLLP